MSRKISLRLSGSMADTLAEMRAKSGRPESELLREYFELGVQSRDPRHTSIAVRLEALEGVIDQAVGAALTTAHETRGMQALLEHLIEVVVPLLAESVAINRELALDRNAALLADAQRKARALIRATRGRAEPQTEAHP